MVKFLDGLIYAGVAATLGLTALEAVDTYEWKKQLVPKEAQARLNVVKGFSRDLCQINRKNKIHETVFAESCLGIHWNRPYFEGSEDGEFADNLAKQYKECPKDKDEGYAIRDRIRGDNAKVKRLMNILNTTRKNEILTAYGCDPQGLTLRCNYEGELVEERGELNCTQSRLTEEQKKSLEKKLFAQ